MRGTVSKFVMLPFWLATGVLLSLTIWVAWYVYDQNRELGFAVETDFESVRYAEELALGVREIRTHLNRYLLTRDPKQLEPIEALDQATLDWLEKSAGTIRTEIGRSYIEQIRGGYRQFQQDYAAAASLTGEDRWNAINQIKDELFNAIIVEYSTKYLYRKHLAIRETLEKHNAFAQRMFFALVLLGLCGVGAGTLVGYLWSVSLRRAVVQLSLPIHNAEGLLSEVIGPVTVRGAPKSFEDLQGSLDTLAEQVSQVVFRLQRSQREALRAEQLAAVGQMAAGMAHELRNPLTSVKILIQAANERRALNPRDLLVLEQEVSRLENLIQTFLDFARPPQAEKHRLDFRDVIHDTLRLFQSRADRLNTRITSVLPSCPVWVIGDRTQLHQLLLNLLINALDAIGRSGEIGVELSLRDDRALTADDERMVLRITDDGCGLPNELGEKIFDPFVSTKQTGIGMGLSICRRIVEDHGGKITAHARVPRGTLLEVTLPVASVEPLAVHP